MSGAIDTIRVMMLRLKDDGQQWCGEPNGMTWKPAYIAYHRWDMIGLSGNLGGQAEIKSSIHHENCNQHRWVLQYLRIYNSSASIHHLDSVKQWWIIKQPEISVFWILLLLSARRWLIPDPCHQYQSWIKMTRQIRPRWLYTSCTDATTASSFKFTVTNTQCLSPIWDIALREETGLQAWFLLQQTFTKSQSPWQNKLVQY